MRFSAAIQVQEPPRDCAAAEIVRRFFSGEPPPRTEPPPLRFDELPADLDQRVRLVGEW
jgi:hypothetical protein